MASKSLVCADVARIVHLASVGDGPPTLVHIAAIAEAAL